jgi:divalent metal cation (Fe/Co/Zn/Cd) transporter
MKTSEPLEFPPEQETAYRKARRLEYVTVAYVASSVVFLYFVMGSSQAMRTSWLENTISIVPPVAFLVCSRLARMKPSHKFPYGMHTAVSIGYITSALALTGMGGFLFVEAAVKLVTAERTTIGGYDLFGTTVWAGWPMLAALTYTSVPSFFLGRAKLKLAPRIHDKILYADAEMNRADWMSEVAAAVGVVGTGFGIWWADGVAAGIVSLDILRDGFRNMRSAITDLIDETPKATEGDSLSPLPGELERYLESFAWVESAEVRMREEGHVYFGEAFVVPREQRDLVARIEELSVEAKAFNWRIHDLTIMPVTRRQLQKDRERIDGTGPAPAEAQRPDAATAGPQHRGG